MATAVTWNVSWFILQAAFVPYAVARLGLDAAAIGQTLGAYGVGMVAGAAAAPWLTGRMRFGALIAAGPAVSVAAAASVAGSIVLPNPALPVLGFFLFGFGPILWTIGQTTLRQAVTPHAMLGRVSALVMMATSGARPLGAAIGGLVGSSVGLQAAILLATAGFVAQWLVLVLSPVPRLQALPDPAA
jgi:predicted MFS family arabinose efflux permease